MSLPAAGEWVAACSHLPFSQVGMAFNHAMAEKIIIHIDSQARKERYLMRQVNLSFPDNLPPHTHAPPSGSLSPGLPSA